MKQLYIFARPVQMIVVQLQEKDKVLESINCSFNDTINYVQKYLKNYNDIETIIVVGQTEYTDKMEQLVKTNFQGNVNIERIS